MPSPFVHMCSPFLFRPSLFFSAGGGLGSASLETAPDPSDAGATLPKYAWALGATTGRRFCSKHYYWQYQVQ